MEPAAAQVRAAVRVDPHGPAAQAYRTWVRVVLMPLSEKAAGLVMDHADLLENSNIEPMLLQLVSHVSAYKVVLRRWEEGQGGAEQSAIAYPDEIHRWVSEGFAQLKRRQAALLGISGRQRGSPHRLIALK